MAWRDSSDLPSQKGENNESNASTTDVEVLINQELQLNFYRSIMQRYSDNNSSSDNSELKDAIDSSIFKKIKRVENEALVQIMNDFIRGIVSEPKRLKEKQSPKEKQSK